MTKVLLINRFSEYWFMFLRWKDWRQMRNQQKRTFPTKSITCMKSNDFLSFKRNIYSWTTGYEISRQSNQFPILPNKFMKKRDCLNRRRNYIQIGGNFISDGKENLFNLPWLILLNSCTKLDLWKYIWKIWQQRFSFLTRVWSFHASWDFQVFRHGNSGAVDISWFFNESMKQIRHN